MSFIVLAASKLIAPNLRRPDGAAEPTLRLTAGAHAKIGAHAVAEGLPATPENNMYGVSDVWNPDPAFAAPSTYVEQGEHTVLAATQGNITLVNADDVPANTAAEDLTGIDFGTAGPPPAPEAGTIRMRSTFVDMVHASVYQAFAPTAISPSAVFDQFSTTPETYFNSSQEVVLGALGDHTVISQISLPDPAVLAWEFEIIAQDPSAILHCGYFVQAFGPPFNPASFAGGPLSSAYRSDGAIFGLGSYVTGFATYGPGDFIGVVYDTGTAQVHFFKNGVYQSFGPATTQGGFQMCGAMSS